jgi:anti-sigma B factor antagonist
MQISATRRPRALVLELSGRLDALSAETAQQTILSQLGEETRLVLDLHGVDYLSSAGIRVLLVAAKTIGRRPDGFFAVALPTPTVRRILCDSGLDACLGLTDDLAAVAD